MKRFTMTLLAAVLALLMTGCTEQEVMAGRGRPEPVIIIVD